VNKIISIQKNIFLTAPLALLSLLILSFGILLPWLGYGFDDWHFIYYSTRGVSGLAELFHYDGHPQATWSFIQSFNLLGYNPVYWHIYSLIWRWLAVVSFWLCLNRIWSNQHRQNFFVASLFAIHPSFTLQVFSISYFEIWIAYTLLLLSFLFTILSIQIPEKKNLFTTLAFALSLFHVFTREYAWFVELMRPVMIWFILPSEDSLKNKTLKTITVWLPFLIIFSAALIWRGFFYTPLRKFFQVQDDIFANPLQTLIIWLTDLIPDVSIVLFTSWYQTFQAEYFYLLRPLNIGIIILLFLIIVVMKKYINKIESTSQNEDWATQAFLLGLPSILLGILPFYIASYSIHLTETPHNTRLAIGMLPGAALITVALIEKITSKPNFRNWFMILIIGLSVTWHIRYTNDYRKIWEYQSNLLQQLIWRVPSIEKNTALYVWQPSLPELDHQDTEIALYADFSTSMAINSIYQVNPQPTESKLSYWYYSLSDESINISQSVPLHSEHATTFFDGNSADSIFFYYHPENNRCLHLITNEDQNYKQYPNFVKDIASYTNTNRINAELVQNKNLTYQIFDESQKSWCFYYQKAELARQYQSWNEISILWQEISQNNLRTEFGTEYIPFIDGFAQLGDWQTAKEITFQANRISKAMDSILCPLWNTIEQSTPTSAEKDNVIKQVYESLGCTE
jgi:hypothetical protein